MSNASISVRVKLEEDEEKVKRARNERKIAAEEGGLWCGVWISEAAGEWYREARDGVRAPLLLSAVACFLNIALKCLIASACTEQVTR